MGTFVLIHGAGTGGWLWDDVADRLRRRGATVHAPTLSGVGDRVANGGPNTNVTTHVAEAVQKPPADPLVATADALRAAGWSVQDLATGHFAMLTTPERLTTLLYTGG